MNDCAGREIEIGDEVAFSVGTKLLTGTVVKLSTGRRYQAQEFERLKIKLTTPEDKTRKIWNRVLRQYDMGEPRFNHFRNVDESYRIIILRKLG